MTFDHNSQIEQIHFPPLCSSCAIIVARNVLGSISGVTSTTAKDGSDLLKGLAVDPEGLGGGSTEVEPSEVGCCPAPPPPAAFGVLKYIEQDLCQNVRGPRRYSAEYSGKPFRYVSADIEIVRLSGRHMGWITADVETVAAHLRARLEDTRSRGAFHRRVA